MSNAPPPRSGGAPSRREFVKTAGALLGASLLGPSAAAARPSAPVDSTSDMSVTIERVDTDFEREPLAHSFGFKGSFLTELWQTVARLESPSGTSGIGLGTQSVLWADSSVFASHSESGGNALMYALTERALQRAEGRSFETPVDLLERLLGEVHEYGRTITGDSDLQETFALNALVAVDNAAWLLYAAENGIEDFDDMIPAAYRPGLSHRHDAVASIPTFGYGVSPEEVGATAEEGYYFLKIKIGHPGSQEEMLKKDKQRLSALHEVVGPKRTPHTESGRLSYYLDANGRYENQDTLRRLLDHADAIGALDQIVIVEEPFAEGVEGDVSGLGVRIAADESASTAEGARRAIQRGYGAVALKPIAKTLSMTMKIAQIAYEHDIPCFCTDLTVNPTLVDWNKNIAARLPPFPGFKTGLMETNGRQHYANWEQMQGYHPFAGAPWQTPQNGVFALGDDFYEHDGGLFRPPEHYRALVQPQAG